MCQTAVARAIPFSSDATYSNGKCADRSVAADAAHRLPFGVGHRVRARRLLRLDATALLLLTLYERTRGVVHQPFDPHQDVGAASGQQCRALRDLATRLGGS